MDSKWESSESSSSPEKTSPGKKNTEVRGRRSLRPRANIYPELPVLTKLHAHETSRSPVRNENVRNSPNSARKPVNSSGEDEPDDAFKNKRANRNLIKRTYVDFIPESIDFKSSPSPKPEAFRQKTPAPEPKSTGNNFWVPMALIVVIVAIAFALFGKSQDSDEIKSDKINCSQFLELKKNFPNQDKKLFKSLQSGVEGAYNEKPPEPSVFALFSTDKQLISNFMHEVLSVIKQCTHQLEDPLSLEKEHLSNKLVTDYKDELTKRTIMIINNLDEASPEDVPTLHSFCDTENPLVEKSIIFITIKVPHSPTGKPVEYINDYLNDRWSSLAENIRGPLITRMIDQTFFLKP